MKTRTGKIAQLPKLIRDELNQRLQNGKQGPDLLKWLNALPETQTLLAEKFDTVPISKQNLSEWRQGGYEEWLRHQDRDLRIQRLVEEGTSIGEHEANSHDDLFEHSARIALAELMADFDSLREFKGEERTNRLRIPPPQSNQVTPHQPGGDPLGAPASRPAQPLPSPRSDSAALPVPAATDDRVCLTRPCDSQNAIVLQAPPISLPISPLGPSSAIPQPKTLRVLAEQNALSDFLRQAALRKSLCTQSPPNSANNIYQFGIAGV